MAIRSKSHSAGSRSFIPMYCMMDSMTFAAANAHEITSRNRIAPKKERLTQIISGPRTWIA